jgi:hypothetical protein
MRFTLRGEDKIILVYSNPENGLPYNRVERKGRKLFK